MKNLFMVLMCFQLIVAPLMTPSNAWAQGGSTGEEPLRLLGQGEAPPPGMTNPGADGGSSGGGSTGGIPLSGDPESYRSGGADAGNSADFYVKQVLSIANACLATNIIMQCGMGTAQPSIWIFMAGGLVTTIGEFASGTALNDKHKRSADNLKIMVEEMKGAAGDGSLQKATVEAMKKNEEDMRDFLKKRRNWMIAASALYWAAAAMGLIEFWLSFSPPAGIGKTDNAGCSANHGWALVLSTTIATAFVGLSQANSDSLATGLVGGGISALIALFSILIPSVGSAGSVVWNTGVARGISFGVVAALATWVAVGLADKLSVVEQNIKDLQALLDSDAFKDPNGTTGGIELAGTGGANGGLSGGSSNYKADTAESDATPDSPTCASRTPKGGVIVSSNCSAPLNFQPPRLDPHVQIPEIDSAYSEISDAMPLITAGKGEAQIAGLAAKAGRMKALTERLQKDINKKLKDAGKPSVDFDGERKKQMAQMIQAYNKAAASSGGPLASASAASLDVTAKDANASATGALGKPAAAAAGAMAPISIGGEEPIAEAAPAPAASLSDSLGQFETSENDINKQSDVSIFALISNRYVLNYGRVMKRKDPAPAAPKEATPAPK